MSVALTSERFSINIEGQIRLGKVQKTLQGLEAEINELLDYKGNFKKNN